MDFNNLNFVSALLGSSLASGDKVFVQDVSAAVDPDTGLRSMTADELKNGLAALAQALTALTGPNAADADTINVYDASAAAQRLMTMAELARAQNRTTAYAADGAITISPGTAKLSKAGVGAYTLAAPSAGQEGTRLVITSSSANAHVVTATGLIEDGVTGGAKNTATFAAFAGATIELVAINLKWHVVANNNVTVA